MASFWFLLVVLNILPFINSPLLCLASDHLNSEPSSTISASPALQTNPPQSTVSDHLNSEPSSTISASPALQTNPPQSTVSPYQELSPDISPLLPSPGGVVPTPTGSSMPTIPANPSPPNPDAFLAPGPDSAFSPFWSLPASSAPRNLLGHSNVAAFPIGATCWSIYQLLMI